MKHLKTWLTANRGLRERIAMRAGTSVAYLMQVANGARSASAALAADLEKAGGPPREHTCEACSKCPYAKGAK